jgi:hypothetical protein
MVKLGAVTCGRDDDLVREFVDQIDLHGKGQVAETTINGRELTVTKGNGGRREKPNSQPYSQSPARAASACQ